MDVNETIVKTLEEIGVEYVFGGSGQVNASMLLALEKSTKIQTVIVNNEQAASFMAAGYAMYSDKLGVCFATGGPGAFNLFSGLAVAYSDSLPVLAITGYTSRAVDTLEELIYTAFEGRPGPVHLHIPKSRTFWKCRGSSMCSSARRPWTKPLKNCVREGGLL